VLEQGSLPGGKLEREGVCRWVQVGIYQDKGVERWELLRDVDELVQFQLD
jgi:hypothetical protein